MDGTCKCVLHFTRRIAPLVAGVLGIVLSGSFNDTRAQATVRQSPIHTRPIGVDVDMVLVNVTVTGPDDRIVNGLERSAFEVYDDKVPQRITAFSTEEAPVAVGIIFDSSGSMADKMERSKQAGLEFLNSANSQDEFLLIQFDSRPDLVDGFTSNSEDLQYRLMSAKPGGTTALVDAIYMGLEKMRDATLSRKALLVISDGGENHSRYTTKDLRRAVQESDVQIYAVGVLEPLGARHRTQEEARGPGLLGEIAEMSGGQMFVASDGAGLVGLMKQISWAMRSQYVIGYKPSNLVRDGRWRRVKVSVQPPDGGHLHVYARTGYYAPTQ